MKKMKTVGAALSVTAGLSLLSAACTQERAYEHVHKQGVLDKAIIDTESEYLYLPSVVDSPRTTSATRPHWMGDVKRVKFKFTEDSLKVLEVEADSRFADNTLNTKPVLSIPVEYKDYRCALNDLKECTNKEEEVTDVNWDQKSKFKPDFSDLEVEEVNFLPIEITNLLSRGACYKETSAQIAHHHIDSDGSLNIQLDRTYSANLGCVSELESLSDLNFTVRYHYSLVKADQLSSGNYGKILYPEADQNKFGFFTTEYHRLSQDNRDEELGKVTLLNRWNPAKQKITYFLSDNFGKPEHASVRAATYHAFQSMNRSLARSGAQLQLELKDGAGHQSGDLRNNMVVMVEDPQAINIIGYGPTVAHPLTGEIVHGRTVMYLGTIKKFIRRAYDEIVRTQRTDPSSVNPPAPSFTAGPDFAGTVGPAVQAAARATAFLEKAKTQSVSRVPGFSKPHVHGGHSHGTAGETPSDGLIRDRIQVEKLVKQAKNYTLNTVELSSLEKRLEVLSKNNAYPAEYFDFAGSVNSVIDSGQIQAALGDGPLKPWAELTEAQKTTVMGLLLPAVWVPTLVHEVGHNLGLRHNFAGSEDAENFYTQEELAAMGINRPVTYSSIMDYSYGNLNELSVFGKYDVAALRFAYKREAEKKDGSIFRLPGGIAQAEEDPEIELKNYQFCTDEHVSVNAGCNRFDEGSSLREIAIHWVKIYEEAYKRNNFRMGRRNFSLFDNHAYALRIDSSFFQLRLFFELYERINNQFNIPAELWETNEFLKDLSQATDIAAGFFLQTVLTPDVLCAAVHESNPTQIIGVAPLSALGGSVSCFDPALQEGLIPGIQLVGQGGKSFQSVKDSNSENPFADQIDVRGIWMDKLLAVKHLLKRTYGNGITDRFTENFLHRPGMSQAVFNVFRAALSDSVEAPVVFETSDGELFQITLGYNLAESHRVAQQGPSLARFLALPSGEASFSSLLVEAVKREVPAEQHTAAVRPVVEAFGAYSELPQNGRPLEDFSRVDFGTSRYLALPENLLATEAMRNVHVGRLLGQLPEAWVQAIAVEKTQNGEAPVPSARLLDLIKADVISNLPEGTTEEQQAAALERAETQVRAAYAIPLELIVAFAEGQIKDEAFYEQLLHQLAGE